MRVELSPYSDTARTRFIITRNDSETGLETMIDHRFQRSGQERCRLRCRLITVERSFYAEVGTSGWQMQVIQSRGAIDAISSLVVLLLLLLLVSLSLSLSLFLIISERKREYGKSEGDGGGVNDLWLILSIIR